MSRSGWWWVVLLLAGTVGCSGQIESGACTGPCDAGSTPDGAGTNPDGGGVVVVVTPATAVLAPLGTVRFSATVTGAADSAVTWSATGGTIDADGLYQAPSTLGHYEVQATSVAASAASGTAQVTVTATGTDTEPPTVTMTAPAPGATLSGTVTVSADASDDVGVAGVQFLLDGAPLGGEDSSGPYSLAVDTTTVSNGPHTLSATARDAAGNTATASGVDVTVSNALPSGDHPRIFLDAATLESLRSRAQAGSPEWTRLSNVCNAYLGGTVNPVGGNAYPNLPDIGEGYQGSDYLPAVLNAGLCYQIGSGIGEANTDQWGQKGAEILDVMAQFTNYGRDSGYGIRFFGVGMALGYDWLYPALSTTVRMNVGDSLSAWLTWYDANGFGRGHPHGNYFAGYYAAKAYAALATEGDDSGAAAQWDDFLNRLHFGGPGALSGPEGTHEGVQSYYAKYLTGGGWAEGWGYGPLAVANMGLPSLAAMTAKGLDLITNAKPFGYPLDNGLHFIHFAFPTRVALDDRDLLHTGADYPSAPSTAASLVTAYLMRKWNHPEAAQAQAFARQIRTEQGQAAPWQEMLFWDGAAPEESYATLPPSYLARGMNAVAMRSDWTTGATWASFRAVGYVDNPWAGEQNCDAGGLAIVKDGTPFLANATGALASIYPGTTAANESDILDDGTGPRELYNTFYNGTGKQVGAAVDEGSGTRVAAFEDGHGYVRLRGERLEEQYNAAAALSGWTRDVVYLRPGAFVVYDRTVVSSVSDPHLHWHLYMTPAQVAAPSTGAVRYDVSNAQVGFMGAMTTLLPADASTALTNPFGNKVYRVEVRSSSPAASMQWLTVFETGDSADAVAVASSPTTSANVVGALLVEGGANRLVLFNAGAADATVSGTVTATVPAAATTLVATDLAASTDYRVTATAAGTLSITVEPGSGFTTSANGTLYVRISAAGVVTAGD